MNFATNINECLEKIKEEIEIKDRTILHLKEENKKLKDEAYKDTELQEMKNQFDKLFADYTRSFPISEKEWESISTWMRKHQEEAHGAKTEDQHLRLQGCSGGRYTYIFTPTGLGISGVIRCVCGAEFEFQEIG